MISPHALFISKTAFKTAVIVVALEVAAYEISPETFNTIAVGVGALAVGAAALVSAVLLNRSNRKSREQVAKIATDQAEALKITGDTAILAHEIKVSMDGRMDQLLETVTQLAEAAGIKKGRAQVHDEITAAAAENAKRDSKIVSQAVGAIVERIGDAADKAAQTQPGSGAERTPPAELDH